MGDGGDCRTAPATPGLLKITHMLMLERHNLFGLKLVTYQYLTLPIEGRFFIK